MWSFQRAARPSRLRSSMSGATTMLFLICLSWLSGLAAAEKTGADYFVHSLPGAPEPLLKMHAGHIEITPEHHGNLFFWHFQNRHIANRQRTVLWINGGPGCSSMDGAMMEVGPYRVKKDGVLEYNKGSWDEFANLLFVDNPVGTGFSFVDTDSYVHELTDMADQMVQFLEKFFELFPEYIHDDLYLAGESYAGQHIPYIAQAILDRNAESEHKWNLSGLLIGNGWISGADQYPAYLQYAYKEGLLEPDSADAKTVEGQAAICSKDLAAGGKDHIDTVSCERILQEILRQTQSSPRYEGKCMNMYDIRLSDEYPSCGMNWPPDLNTVTPYLRRVDVTRALHISPDKKSGWKECTGSVSSAFTARNSKPAVQLLPDLLERVPIILFSGDRDMICNHLGTEEMINNLSWNGGTGMEISPGVWAPRRDWTFEGDPAGIWQEARNLTYVLFYNSSHMVPFDYPRRTRDMLDRFMGVDIASIGGDPADSRIDGEKGIETSVGGHPNSTTAEEAEKDRLDKATYKAYYKSGEVALVIVLIAAGVWAWFVWRARRRTAGYRGVFGSDPSDGRPPTGLGLSRLGKANGHRADLEAADFDEAELDDLAYHDPERERFDVGHDSDDDDGHTNGHANGHK